ncbi:MAG: hypothetical protein ACI4XK_04145 [Bacilli bacterium]
MKKNIGIIVGVVGGILVIALIAFAVIKFKSNTPSPSPTPDTNGDAVKDEETIKKEQDEKIQANIEKAKLEVNANLEETLIKYMKNEFKESIDWRERLKDHPEGFEMILDLNAIKGRGYDVSMFQTDSVKCDGDKTFAKFNVSSTGVNYSASLCCEYSFKINEKQEIIK